MCESSVYESNYQVTNFVPCNYNSPTYWIVTNFKFGIDIHCDLKTKLKKLLGTIKPLGFTFWPFKSQCYSSIRLYIILRFLSVYKKLDQIIKYYSQSCYIFSSKLMQTNCGAYPDKRYDSFIVMNYFAKLLYLIINFYGVKKSLYIFSTLIRSAVYCRYIAIKT